MSFVQFTILLKEIPVCMEILTCLDSVRGCYQIELKLFITAPIVHNAGIVQKFLPENVFRNVRFSTGKPAIVRKR